MPTLGSSSGRFYADPELISMAHQNVANIILSREEAERESDWEERFGSQGHSHLNG